MAKANVNGVDLFYEISGAGEVPLVFVHGSWGSHHNWDAVAPRLAETFRVLTYHRRGHSESERPLGQGSVREDVADLAALIEHLGLAPAWVAGNSFGAAITLRLAGERPDLLRGIVAHEPPLFALLANDPPGAWARLPPDLQQTFITNAPTYLDECRDPEQLSVDLAVIASFACPSLLTKGDQGPPMFAPVIEKLAAVLSNVTVATFNGAGHIPHATHPDAYVETLSTFIRTHAT